jgi:hypothetical protein
VTLEQPELGLADCGFDTPGCTTMIFSVIRVVWLTLRCLSNVDARPVQLSTSFSGVGREDGPERRMFVAVERCAVSKPLIHSATFAQTTQIVPAASIEDAVIG